MSSDPQTGTPRSPTARIVGVLRRWKFFIALWCVVPAGVAYLSTATKPNTYSATATLLFRSNSSLDQTLFGAAQSQSLDPQRDADTNLGLVELPAVADRTARALGREFTRERVISSIVIKAAGQSSLVHITATDEDPRVATRMANAVGEQFIRFRRDADTAKVNGALRLVEADLARVSSSDDPRGSRASQELQRRADELRILAALQTGNAELPQRAELPTEPSGPPVRRNTLLAGGLGLLFGLGLAFLLERLNTRIRDHEELEALTGAPLLVTVPQDSSFSQAAVDRSSAAFESFRLLRTRMRFFNVDTTLKTLVVTSAAQGDGKSTVAWQLAVAAAERGRSRVVLVEADMRRPTLAMGRQLVSQPGLSEVLSHNADLNDVIQHVALDQSTVPGNAVSGNGLRAERGGLAVITSGAIPPNPLELIESERCREVLEELANRFELVIFDTPPALTVSESVALMGRADGVLLVARIGNTRRDALRRLTEQLRQGGAPLLGVVANGVRASAQEYGYGYGYGSFEAAEEAGRDVRRTRRPLARR